MSAINQPSPAIMAAASTSNVPGAPNSAPVLGVRAKVALFAAMAQSAQLNREQAQVKSKQLQVKPLPATGPSAAVVVRPSDKPQRAITVAAAAAQQLKSKAAQSPAPSFGSLSSASASALQPLHSIKKEAAAKAVVTVQKVKQKKTNGNDVPEELWTHALSFLNMRDVATFCCVNKEWKERFLKIIEETLEVNKNNIFIHLKAFSVCLSTSSKDEWFGLDDDAPKKWLSLIKRSERTGSELGKHYFLREIVKMSVNKKLLGSAIFATTWTEGTFELYMARSIVNSFRIDKLSQYDNVKAKLLFEATTELLLRFCFNYSGKGDLFREDLITLFHNRSGSTNLEQLLMTVAFYSFSPNGVSKLLNSIMELYKRDTSLTRLTPQAVKMILLHVVESGCLLNRSHLAWAEKLLEHVSLDQLKLIQKDLSLFASDYSWTKRALLQRNIHNLMCQATVQLIGNRIRRNLMNRDMKDVMKLCSATLFRLRFTGNRDEDIENRFKYVKDTMLFSPDDELEIKFFKDGHNRFTRDVQERTLANIKLIGEMIEETIAKKNAQQKDSASKKGTVLLKTIEIIFRPPPIVRSWD